MIDDPIIDPDTLLRRYTPVFAFIHALEASKSFGDPEDLILRTLARFEIIREECRKDTLSPEWVSDAQYAVAAFVDELVGRSDWHGREKWMANPLSSRLGYWDKPGTIFFTKLSDWMRQASPPQEVLKVFHACLGLGFRGQYFDDPETLRRIKADLLGKISGSNGTPGSLSMNWERPRNDEINVVSMAFPWPWLIASSLSAVAILFFILQSCNETRVNQLIELTK